MYSLIPHALAENANTPVQAAANQAGDAIGAGGNQTWGFLSGLPTLVSQLLMAGLVIFLGILVIRLGRRVIARIIDRRSENDVKNAQQMNTIKSLVTSVFDYIMYFVIITMALSVFGVNVTSLLAVAGVGGVAISFGAQTLVKDIISGMFIWVEGNIAVGDMVTINGLTGTVEKVAIRTTTLREFNGNICVIPNGDIRTVTNMSRDFKRAVVDVRCPYEADQARIIAIIEEEMEKAGREIEGIDGKPEVMSIMSFDTDAVVVRVAARCPVGDNWRIERDLRSRIKARFDQEGIEMPHYQKVVMK